MPWDIRYNNGVHLPQIDWWLDAHRPVERSVVSPAHFDHLAAHREIICTPQTARLMRLRLPRRRVEHALPFGLTERLTEDCTITLLPAGHICGSALCLLEHERHGRLLYTGDFKLRPSLTAGICATPRADVLIMETTFGRPIYQFPEPRAIFDEIRAFCRTTLEDGATPVLMAYSLGKTQELLAGLGDQDAPVLLHPQCFALTRMHEEFGLRFPGYAKFSEERLRGSIVIAPPLAPNAGFFRKIPARRTAFVSGWAIERSTVYRQRCDAAFPLSDHADFPELLHFVEAVAPRRVLTVHGFSTDFARTLRERGIDAFALDKPDQLDLGLGLPGS